MQPSLPGQSNVHFDTLQNYYDPPMDLSQIGQLVVLAEPEKSTGEIEHGKVVCALLPASQDAPAYRQPG
jgi:hypothetical protein